MQYNTIPARVYLGSQSVARPEPRCVRLIRSSVRRRAGLRSAAFWAGTVQCAAVRQMKPNHESCDMEITQYDTVYKISQDTCIVLMLGIYYAISHLFICP